MLPPLCSVSLGWGLLLEGPPSQNCLPLGPTGCPLLCPQVSEGPVLVLQPASGLHFPAIEALREAILSRTLEGAWAGAPQLPATFSVPPSAPTGP